MPSYSDERREAVVLKTAAMNDAELAEYCRRRGVYPEQIDAWRQDCEQAASLSQQERRLEGSFLNTASWSSFGQVVIVSLNQRVPPDSGGGWRISSLIHICTGNIGFKLAHKERGYRRFQVFFSTRKFPAD